MIHDVLLELGYEKMWVVHHDCLTRVHRDWKDCHLLKDGWCLKTLGNVSLLEADDPRAWLEASCEQFKSWRESVDRP